MNELIKAIGSLKNDGTVQTFDLTTKEGYEALVGFISVVAAFFMGFWVPEHNGGYSDIMQERYIVEEGALKGIALLPEDFAPT